MTTIAAHPPTTFAQAFERAIHGARDRAAQRAAGIVMRTDIMPPIDESPARVVFRADEHPAFAAPAIPLGRLAALLAVDAERDRQDEAYPLDEGGFDAGVRLAVLTEEVGEVARVQCGMAWGAIGGSHARGRLREELVQVAAVAVRWIESLDVEAER